ncbi:MAG TPA: YtxH domain-containing protein [Anaerolineales bacterium]|nr:YtxH domain-containing protein [Anaerolineales bacterium]
MRRIKHNKRGVSKVVTGLLLGSVLGATVGWLTAPVSGAEIRRRIQGKAMDARTAQERAKTAAGNVETRARELAAEVNQNVENMKESVARRKKAVITD